MSADVEPVHQHSDNTVISDKQTLLAVLQFLKKNNLKRAEASLRKEANLKEEDDAQVKTTIESDVSNVLSSYKSDSDPAFYEAKYSNLKSFIESAPDMYKNELSAVLYPVFFHMNLDLIYSGHETAARSFFEKFSEDQENYFESDLRRLSTICKKDQVRGNHLLEGFRSSKYVIRMSRDTYTYLKRHLQERRENLLLNIIQGHLYIDVFDGVPRNKQQVDATSGAMEGEARRAANKVKVYYGLLKEPELHIPIEDDDDEGSEDKPKKKKPKKDPLFSKKTKTDPNSPSNNRIPLPELKDSDKLEKITAMRESIRRVKVGPNNLPSICFYTFLNSFHGITSADISEDSSLLCAGFGDSQIRVWSLTPMRLRTVKSALELSQIDKEADDVLERMMDDRNAADARVLLGHSGPVYATTFSPDRYLMLSCSEDASIRLWSLHTWSCLICYKGHNYPVWDVKFSPHGYYFATAGMDRTARLWATDHYQPLRIFAGHLADVDSIQFHPNSNYVATGSSDRTVRLWDIASGNCVRYMTGHKGPVQCLSFSPDGRYLASAGLDNKVLIWDVAHGNLIAELKDHSDTIYSLAFSRDGSLLASGGLDYSVKLWNINKLFEEIDTDDINISQNPLVKTETELYMIGSFPTRFTSVLHLHFTRRNLLLAAGMCNK